MSASKTSRYVMFGLLYFAEGAIMSYFTALNAIYLQSFKVSMTQVGIIGGIALIPFMLKIFLGMLSDRVNLLGLGYRKPYILIGLAVQAICLLVVPLINPFRQFGLFAVLAFVLMTGMALYDTCTDGLALDTTPEAEQGTIQGFMVGGRALGVVTVSSVIGLIAQHTSWSAAFLALAIFTLLPLPFVLRVHEAPRPAERQFEWKAFSAFGQRSIIALALLGALYSLITNAANEIVNPFMHAEFGVSVSVAGFFTTAWGIGMVFGGLAGGRLTDRFGQRRSSYTAMVISLATILGLALIFSPGMAWPLVILFGLAFGYYDTVFFTLSMRATDPRIAATMFSILMAVANVGTGIGLAVSGALVDTVGYRLTFVIVAALNVLTIPLISVIFQRSAVTQPVAADPM